MRNLMIIIALICFTLIYTQSAYSKPAEFARTFNCGNEKAYKLCLIGKYPPSKSINLLSQSNSNICKTKTLNTFNYEEYPYDGGQPLPVTTVDTKKCTHPEQYTLAYLEENIDGYQLTAMVLEADKSTIHKADATTRKSKLLIESEKLFSKYLLKEPVLYRPVQNYIDTYIVQYVVHPYPRPVKYGPLFFYANNKITIIDSEATITKTFSLNGRYFVMYDHGCWEGCGNNYVVVLEIQDKQFKTIFKDGTWAD
jgi:hypothetical protein